MFGQVRTFGVNVIPERKIYICTIEIGRGKYNIVKVSVAYVQTFVTVVSNIRLLGSSRLLLCYKTLLFSSLTESNDSGVDLHVNVRR